MKPRIEFDEYGILKDFPTRLGVIYILHPANSDEYFEDDLVSFSPESGIASGDITSYKNILKEHFKSKDVNFLFRLTTDTDSPLKFSHKPTLTDMAQIVEMAQTIVRSRAGS